MKPQIIAHFCLPCCIRIIQIDIMCGLRKHCTTGAGHARLQSLGGQPGKSLIDLGAQHLRNRLQIVPAKLVGCCSKALDCSIS